MGAATKDRNTARRIAEEFSAPVAAGKVIYAGTLVVLNAAGNAEPGTTALDLTAYGMALDTVDNSAGGDGDVNVTVLGGSQAFRFGNDGTVTRADIGATAYIVDDQTVSNDNGDVGAGATRSAAGKIVDVDADGVWIQF